MDAKKAPAAIGGGSLGATGRIRTGDLLITNQLRYQLRYSSIEGKSDFSKEQDTNKTHFSISRRFSFEKTLYSCGFVGFSAGIYLLITNQLLYQLSYASICENRLLKFCF